MRSSRVLHCLLLARCSSLMTRRAALERSDMMAHVALQTLDANADAPGADCVSVKVAASVLRARAADAEAPADVVVTGELRECCAQLRPLADDYAVLRAAQTCSTIRYSECEWCPSCAMP